LPETENEENMPKYGASVEYEVNLPEHDSNDYQNLYTYWLDECGGWGFLKDWDDRTSEMIQTLVDTALVQTLVIESFVGNDGGAVQEVSSRVWLKKDQSG
jgi:hypothetical protein